MWRHENNNLYNDTYKAGIKGIQIKVSNTFVYNGYRCNAKTGK